MLINEIDFKRYKYYYNGWIARKDRQTNKSELFYKGKWTSWEFGTDLDLMANFGDTDLVELSDNDRNKKLLLEKMKTKIENSRTI